MKSSRQILTAHYSALLRKAGTWLGLVALVSTSLVAGPASALGTQMGARSVTPTSLKAASTQSYAISFAPGTTGTIGSLKIELCDSPLESVSCAASGSAGVNSNGANASTASFTSLAGTGCTGGTWAVGAGTGPGVTGTSRKLTNSGTAVAPTTAQTCVLTFGGILNPAGNNQKYYLRLTTYSDTAYTTEVDFGGMALQTAQDLTVTASVQEQLTFCTGLTTAAACGSVGSGAISLLTGTGCPVLSTANVCTGTSQMTASTNGQAGYAITYNGTTLTSGSDTITATGTPGAVSTPATRQFGLALTAQTGSGTQAAVYNFGTNGSKYAYVTGAATQIATGTAANGEATYTVTYAANVDTTTKAGAYTATINYVCTGLF
jgi:hypothetical protein